MTSADKKLKRRVVRQQSEDSTSIGRYQVTNKSAPYIVAKESYSELNQTEFEAGNQGTPLTKRRLHGDDDLSLYDENPQMRRQVTESPFNSPF